MNRVTISADALDRFRAAASQFARGTASRASRLLSVKDDGAGIDEATRARLFEPLFTTKKDGTGLGLSIVDSLVKQHGGRLLVESVPGAGSVFTVELPTSGVSARG